MRTTNIETIEDFRVLCFHIFQQGQQIPTEDGYERTYELGDWIASEKQGEGEYVAYHLTDGRETFLIEFEWMEAPDHYTNRKLFHLFGRIYEQFRAL